MVMRMECRGRPALLAALGVCFVSLLGCGEGVAEPAAGEVDAPMPQDMRHTDSGLYVAYSTLWRPMNVPVCWENPSAGDETKRQWVRNAVARTWEARSGVRFTGWGACANTGSGIRIHISDTSPHTKALGNALNGMAQGMVLNFTFNTSQFCIETSAVHEFGHALGFAHEENRPDRPSSCTEPAQGSSGDWIIGAWDVDSVMNSCNPNWNGNGNLSATDQEGARLSYGVAWESLGGVIVDSPSAASMDTGQLDVYVRGTDNALYRRSYSNIGWSTWQNMGGTLTSDPSAVSWGPGRMDVFARGPNGELIYKRYRSMDGAWSVWTPLGGQLVGKPGAVSWGQGRLHVYVRGTNNALYRRAYDGVWWTPWEALGGTLASEPVAVSRAHGRVDVFARGTDGSVIHNEYDAITGWSSGWESLGGQIIGAPGAVSPSPGQLDVYARGTDNALWHKTYTSGWSDWEWLGGEMTSSPSAESWGTGRKDIVYRGPDNSVRHSWWNNGW